MYIKKILVAVAILGLIAFGIFGYYIYNSIFLSNTDFNSKEEIDLYPYRGKLSNSIGFFAATGQRFGVIYSGSTKERLC